MSDAAKCTICGRDIPADAPGGACPRCALAGAMPAANAPPTAEDVAARLPAFEILGVLGSGGMGVVFKARQKALDRIVALKVLPPATAATPGFSERFGREAKAMARLSHPNIVAVYEFGESGGLYYLVLEFVDGLNVREAMAAGRLTPDEAMAIVPQICDALQYAHDRGVVHRDIKPENILVGFSRAQPHGDVAAGHVRVDMGGRVKIADFGLAKLADREAGDPSLTGAGQVMGTLRYMAPEQWERPKEVDHRADIYSLGVVFYEMLTGELPMGKFEPPSHKAAIDVRVDEIVMRSIERDRERRWQHASDVKTKVGELASRADPSPTPLPAAASAQPRAPVKPSVLPVVVPLLVTILFGVTAMATTSQSPTLCAVFWWLAGLTFFGSLITAVVVWDRARRGVRGAPWPFDAKPGEHEEKEEEPKGRWMPPRTTALVTLAGISAAAVLCGGFSTGPAGMTVSGILFVLGLVLWHQCDERKKAVLASEKGEREHPGPPVAIEVLSAVMIVVGVAGFGYAMLGRQESDDDKEGTHIEVGPFGIHATSNPAKPKDPPNPQADDKAPWEFDVEATEGEEPPQTQLDAQRQGIWQSWSRAQALQTSDWSAGFARLYGADDYLTIRDMQDDARKKAADDGLLGLPLFPRGRAALGKFRIESARLGGWHEGPNLFETAQVRATDGKALLSFTMRYADGVWVFAVSPVSMK